MKLAIKIHSGSKRSDHEFELAAPACGKPAGSGAAPSEITFDGETLLAELEKRGTLRSTPALVISTDATRDRVHRMMALGAQGYVAKPFSPEALRAALDGVLGENHAC